MAQQKQEQDLNQLLKVRRDKLADLQANGKDPFQITKFNQTHHSMEVKSLYEAHEAELLKDRAEVDVTGLDEEQAKEASAAEQNEQTAAQAKPEAEAAKQPEEKKHEDAKQQEASEFGKAQQALAQEHDSYLRLAAEYDNYRKRSQKEKDNLYTEIRSETVEKFLPVYDNLERALAQETQDAAFKKGVEMTMNQLVSVMEKLGVESFGAAGDHFDPQLHNAVMHIEDESLGENVIAEVFQKGFKVGEKVVRFAMVKVAN